MRSKLRLRNDRRNAGISMSSRYCLEMSDRQSQEAPSSNPASNKGEQRLNSSFLLQLLVLPKFLWKFLLKFPANLSPLASSRLQETGARDDPFAQRADLHRGVPQSPHGRRGPAHHHQQDLLQVRLARLGSDGESWRQRWVLLSFFRGKHTGVFVCVLPRNHHRTIALATNICR